jgi:preprotein translocase subunit SecE
MSKDDATWLNICYIAFGGVVAYVCFKAILTLGLQTGWSERYDEWYPMLNNMMGLILGAGGAWWMQSSVDRREYHLATLGELRKVIWPGPEDIKKMTWIVAIVVAIFAVILAVFDILCSKLIQFFV